MSWNATRYTTRRPSRAIMHDLDLAFEELSPSGATLSLEGWDAYDKQVDDMCMSLHLGMKYAGVVEGESWYSSTTWSLLGRVIAEKKDYMELPLVTDKSMWSLMLRVIDESI